MLSDLQLTTATLAAAASLRARLNSIDFATPSWFTEEAAAVLAVAIRQAEANAARPANPFTVTAPVPGTPCFATNAA
jgi:hypothetical protein